MTETMVPSIQVVVVSGLDQAKRLMAGLSMAVAAAAAGTRVRLFLSMDGVQCLDRDACHRVLVPGYPPVAELLGVIRDSGGAVEYCPNCLPSGCDNHVARQAPSGDAPCGCAGVPAGLASYGVRLSECPTIMV